MNSKIQKSILLFVTVTILIQIFYAVTAHSDLSTTRYFPYGYLIHISYYLSLIVVTSLFVGKFDFAAVGIKRVAAWKKYLLVGLFFALLFYGIRTLVVQGTFNRSYALPLELYVPAYLFLGLLIGLGEESAFRGYILRNFLKKYKPILAILFSSLLFGIYHINFLDLNFYSSSFWTFYVVQAFTGGIIMATLYYKTGGNLISSITYHSSNVIVGQIIPWMPLVDTQYLLGVSTIINLILIAILRFSPISRRNLEGQQIPKV